MSKVSKYKFFKKTGYGSDYGGVGVLELENQIRQMLLNKYFNIWMSKFE